MRGAGYGVQSTLSYFFLHVPWKSLTNIAYYRKTHAGYGVQGAEYQKMILIRNSIKNKIINEKSVARAAEGRPERTRGSDLGVSLYKD